MGSTYWKTSNCDFLISAFKGYLYMVVAGVFFSLNSFLVRFARGTPVLQMSMYRFLGMLVFNLPIGVYNGVNLIGPRGSRRILLCRGVGAVCAVIFSFMSFRFLPVGEASVIVFSTPVFVTIFARLLLQEVCGVVQTATVGLTVIGIIFIINPTTLLDGKEVQSTDHTIGVLFGLAALFSQCSMVILTRMTSNVHYSAVCFTSSSVGAITCFLLSESVYNLVLPRCGMMRCVAAAMAVSSSVGQIFFIKALQVENVGPVATLKAATDIIAAVIWQVVFFQETLEYFAITGTSLVLISVILIGLRKWVLMLPKDSTAKKTFVFLTY